MHYLFSVKQNVKDILIDGHGRKEQQNESRLKKLNFGKTLEEITRNELGFHGYSTAKTEILL